MGRHKKVPCGKCMRIMRTDHIKRHMKQHENEDYKNESICGSSIATSRTSLQEETESDFSSISTTKSTPINEELVIKSMVMDSDKYMQDMELGKIVAKTVVEKKNHRIV